MALLAMKGLHPDVDGGPFFKRSGVGPQRQRGYVQRLFVALMFMVVLGGCAEPGPSLAFDHLPASEAAAMVEAALGAEQRHDCGRIYQLLSHASRRLLVGAEVSDNLSASGYACDLVSPQVAYEPERAHWEIEKTTPLEVGRVRVDVLVYGRECFEGGCSMPFFAVEEAGEWRLDLGIPIPSAVPKPITTLVPR